MHTSKEPGVQDYVLLDAVTEDDFYDNLSVRFRSDSIYTYIGDVVVSVNPFKKLDIYKPADIAGYRGRYKYERSPHLYALANDAYRAMSTNKQDQCIIISGESGAGKTEASKIIMQYITAVSKSSGTAERVKEALLESNPLLEAFGNAKTIRNDNSSRFGKYMEMQFSVTGAPVGGRITNYLLEKSRVVTRAQGERSFHIFYQMLAGLPQKRIDELQLTRDAETYHYLQLSKCTTVSSINDVHDFGLVTKAMDVLGIKNENADSIYNILAGILHIGNVTFAETKSKDALVSITNMEAVKKASKCLGIQVPALIKALSFRSISVDSQKQPQTAKSSEQFFVPYDLVGAIYSRDALAKALYERLFSWMVECINQSIQTSVKQKDYQVIGILDIYGFEIFERNSFEQLNINYCNEKLQQLFIELTLKSEQEEYVREGIEWTQIDYFNNKTICDLVEKKPIGIISLMDDEGMIGSSTDQSFLEKLDRNFSQHPHYQSYTTLKDKALTTSMFRLKHYAGDVSYDVNGMLDKNKDALSGDLIDLALSSNIKLLQQLFTAIKKVDSKKRPETSGSQFRNAMNALVTTLLACNPHYVRCIKSNDSKQAGNLDEMRVRHQIRYLGLVENVRVRRAGFANRQEFSRFYQRYKMLSRYTWPHHPSSHNKKNASPEAILAILNDEQHRISKEEYRIGKTKVFIRNPRTLFYFEEKRTAALPAIATIIQKLWRGYKARVLYKQLRAAITLQSFIRLKTTMAWYKTTMAALMVQKAFRGYKERSVWRRKKAVLKIQAWYRWAKAMQWIRDVSTVFADVLNDPLFGKYLVWPTHLSAMEHGGSLVKRIHLSWRVRKLIATLSPEQVPEMRIKVDAYDIFHRNKPYSFSRKFMHNYVEKSPLIQPPKYQKLLAELPGSKTILFADIGMRMNSKGALDKRLLIFTESHIHTCKVRNMSLRGSVALNEIQSITLNALEEWTTVIHVKRPGQDLVLNLGPQEPGADTETTTELVTLIHYHINKASGISIPVEFSDKITFFNKKQATLSFQGNPQASKFTTKISKGVHTLTYPVKPVKY